MIMQLAPKENEARRRRRRPTPVKMMFLALVLCLIGGIGANAIKTVGYSVEVTAVSHQTPSGTFQSGQLFVPPNATTDEPAPAVVVAHGGSLTSEYPQQHYIELARRGYVVYSIDMYGHGRSETVGFETMYNGVFDGVQYLATLPYVDATQIGVTGNSNGAFAVDLAVMIDNALPEPSIAAALYVVNDPTLAEGHTFGAFHQESNTDYLNLFGSRDAGIITADYDVTFNRVMREDGTVSAPRDFVQQPVAQSFLRFGNDPAGLEERNGHTLYSEKVDGEEAVRVIYDQPMIHPWTIISSQVTADSLEFFEAAMPAPNPLPVGDQIWQWRAVFSVVGLVGLLMFLVSFVLVMVRTPFFAPLQATTPVRIRDVDTRGKAWLWVGMSVAAIFGAVSFVIVYWAAGFMKPDFLQQSATYSLGMWAALSGLVTLLILVLNYRRYSRKRGLDLRAEGVILPRGTALKSLLLGALAPAAMYLVVFAVEYFFRTDFHIWTVLGFNTFTPAQLLESLKYLPFFLVYFAALSVATNVFNYVRIGKREWVNLTVMTILNTLGTVLILVVVFAIFIATGNTPLDEIGLGVFSPTNVVFNVMVIVPIATVIMRLIYRATRNPYLPAVAVAVLITVMTGTRALTLG